MQRIAALVQHSANDRLERAVIPTPVLLLLLSVIPRAVEGPARSDSFFSTVQANRSALIPRRPLALGSVGMTRERAFTM
jgi:hypothetical protein